METKIINHNGYDYKYSIKNLRIEDGEQVVQFICRGAKMNEEFLESDIPELMKDLPNILDKLSINNKNEFIKIRISKSDKVKIEKNAKKLNIDISKYILDKCI